MERRFSQLRWKDRLRIEKMMKEGRKIREIAEALHVHNSTIYREIKRGMTWQLVDWEYVEIYCPETAERKYQENMRAKGPGLKIGSDRALEECLEHLIADEHFSPAVLSLGDDSRHVFAPLLECSGAALFVFESMSEARRAQFQTQKDIAPGENDDSFREGRRRMASGRMGKRAARDRAALRFFRLFSRRAPRGGKSRSKERAKFSAKRETEQRTLRRLTSGCPAWR